MSCYQGSPLSGPGEGVINTFHDEAPTRCNKGPSQRSQVTVFSGETNNLPPSHCLISLLCYVPLPLTSAVSAYSEPSPFEKLDCDESSELRHIWISGDLRWRPQTIIQMIQIQLLWRVEPETNLCQGPIRAFSWLKLPTCAYCFTCKALVGVLNQEKALVGAFSVICETSNFAKIRLQL